MDLHEKALSEGDPRTVHWPLISSPTPVLALIIAYIWFTKKGPKMMENYKPLSLKSILLPYNVFLVFLSIYMFKEFLITSYLSGYSYTCQRVDYSNEALPLRMANVVWWYFFSKALELMDTVFFILRKKPGQVTFLHVYHHCTMLLIWWVGVKYVPGGQAFFSAMINSFVHIIMYSYYALSALGESVRPYLWWKRYLTQIQLIQFMAIILHVVMALYNNCRFPQWMNFIGIAYCATLTVLFLNYYVQTYINKRKMALKLKS